MHNLIINADDFGMSKEINSGIKQAVKAGVINNVSVMVNMPYFEDAIAFLKKHPEVSVGLHFNITERQPILLPSEIGSLIREDNNFYHWSSLMFFLILKKAQLKQIEKELWAQYLKLKSTGVPISHIDSHHHIHLYPSLFKKVSKLADKENIRTIRCNHFNIWTLTTGTKRIPTFKQLFIALMLWTDSALYHHRNSKNNSNLNEVDGLYDINWNQRLNSKDFLKILDHLPKGVTELICHVGVISPTGNKRFLEPRFKALKMLTLKETRDKIINNGIQLLRK